MSKTISLNDGSRNKTLPKVTSFRVFDNWIEFTDVGNPVHEEYYKISGISFGFESIVTVDNDLLVYFYSFEDTLSTFSFPENSLLVLTNRGSEKTLTIKLKEDAINETTEQTNHVYRYEYRFTDSEIATIRTDFFVNGATIDAYIVIGNENDTIADILPDMRGSIISIRQANASEGAAVGYQVQAEYVGYDDYIRRVNTVYNDELLRYWSVTESGVFVYGGGYTGDVILQYYAKLGKESNTSSRLADYIPCLLYTSPSPRDRQKSRMPSSA